MKSLLIGFTMTFFPMFDLPVFWPVLLLYWIMLFTVTMKKQIKHMIKYKYLPFSFGKKVSSRKSHLPSQPLQSLSLTHTHKRVSATCFVLTGGRDSLISPRRLCRNTPTLAGKDLAPRAKGERAKSEVGPGRKRKSVLVSEGLNLRKESVLSRNQRKARGVPFLPPPVTISRSTRFSPCKSLFIPT